MKEKIYKKIIYKLLSELDKSTWRYRYRANLTQEQMLVIDYIFMEAFYNCNLLPKVFESRFRNVRDYLKEGGFLNGKE